MGKGPEFFPGWIPSRDATNHSATRLGAAGRVGKGKSHPNRRNKEGKGQKRGAAPARGRPGGSRAPRRERGPDGGAGGLRSRGCAPRAAFSTSRFKHPKSRRNFAGVAGFFPALFCFGSESV